MGLDSFEDGDEEMDAFEGIGRGACYSPDRDGPLDAYLREFNTGGTHALFDGMEAFELLQREGWLEPRFSMIRLMWNQGRGDEVFEVTEDFKLEGIENPSHCARSGVHEPADIFKDAPPFEAHNLLRKD